MPAEPHVLAPLRRTLRRWLRTAGASAGESHDVVLACGEACANAIQHAYGVGEGVLEVQFGLAGADVEVIVRDSGTWRTAARTHWGRGLELMRSLMDGVEVDTLPDGTSVRMRRRLAAGVGS
jgi:anti-sigma regulatory factor (Ser/Thr protein kinase)